jgi:hypothetical protein
LARRLKDVHREIDAATLAAIGDEWHWRAGTAMVEVDPCEVRALLKNAFARCRYGLTERTLKGEYLRRKAEPPSEIANRFCNPRLREAVRVLEAAQRLNPNGDFAMPGERLGDLIGCSQVQAAKHLKALCEEGVLVVTAEFEFKKRARRYRLVLAVVKSVAEKIRETLSAVAKLVARAVGSVTATSEPTEPKEPQAAASEPTERAWYDPDPNQAPYVPPAPRVPSGTGRDRDGPPPKSASGWRWRSWREVVFGMTRPKPAQISESEPILDRKRQEARAGVTLARASE